MKLHKKRIPAILFSLAVAVFVCACVSAADGDREKALAFYNGKTGRFIVPYSPGGGYDIMARLMAPFLKKYIPGSTWIVENKPGAGGIVGTNMVYTARPDGLTIGILPGSGTVISAMAELPGVRYKLDQFAWLGRLCGDDRFMMVRNELGIKTIEDFKNYAGVLKQSFTEVGSPAYAVSKLLAEVIPYNVREITGYEGRSEEEMAFFAGDIDILVGTASLSIPLLNRGEATLVYIATENPPEGIDPSVPNLFTDSGRAFVDADRQVWLDFLISVVRLGRPVVAGPGIPAERQALLEEAVYNTLTDPEFVAQILQATKIQVDALNGTDTKAMIDVVTQSPENIRVAVKAMLTK